MIKCPDCKTPSRFPHPCTWAKPHVQIGSIDRCPGKTSFKCPGKISSRRPGKTPSRYPGKTPSRCPGKTPSRSPGNARANLRHDRSPFPFCPGKKNRSHTHTTSSPHLLSLPGHLPGHMPGQKPGHFSRFLMGIPFHILVSPDPFLFCPICLDKCLDKSRNFSEGF